MLNKKIKLMKKLVIFPFILLSIFCASLSETFYAKTPFFSYPVGDAWTKSKTGVWIGQYNIRYKRDKKGTITYSKDGKSWKPAKDNVWLDHLGKQMKIAGNKVQWSNDAGKTWSETPEWKWQGGDGKWYKFDKSFTLWVINS
jgi:hypothetical protein